MAESRGHAQRHETPVHREPTIVQLPGVGEADASIFAISPPEPMERPPYRPPIPVALIPPDEEHSQPAFHSQPDYSGHGPLTEDAVFPLTEPGVYGEEEQVYELDPYSSSLEESTSEGSIAALLEQQNAPRVGSHAKSKDEILDELLGVVPPKKKKGLSASSVVMLVTTALVLIVASLGTFYVIQKAGGTSVTSEDVLGEEGLSNLSKKPESVKEENRGAEKSRLDVSQAADKTSSAEPSPLKQTEEKKPEPAVTKSAAAPQTVSATVTSAAPPQPTAIPEPTPTPSPVVAKKNYQPRPFFEAPKPGDPPLLNMHDLIDAFMRAPHAEARIPYIYHGESLRPSVIDYYKRWPDFSVDDFRVRWHSSEDAPETGGPFWVFLISRVGQEDEIEIPLIIRSENGRLKVDWETFAEFWDQHYVHFFKNGAFNPPHHFRLVIERMSEYPGPDKPGFTELKDYLCYSLNPPYGSFQAYQEYAFVKAGTSLAKQIDERVGLGETGLAVIVKVDKKDFSHGVRHWVITELSQEGWLK